MTGLLHQVRLVVGHPAQQDELELERPERGGSGHVTHPAACHARGSARVGVPDSTQDPHLCAFQRRSPPV